MHGGDGDTAAAAAPPPHPLALDLKLSALAAAAQHYRRATVLRPFPPFFDGGGGGRDYTALEAALNEAAAPPAALLRWLAEHPAAPAARLAPVTLRELLRAAGPPAAAWAADIAANPSLLPDHAFVLDEDEAWRGAAFLHGTSFENVHSILHAGLVAASGTPLERSGTLYGDGVYATSDLRVAAEFASSQPAWARSALGRRLRAILVCSVADGPPAADNGSGGGGEGSSVPAAYRVARPADVRVRGVLVYVDAAPGVPAAPRRVPWLAALLAAYALWLLLVGLGR
jgi:poly[ADP-ribose] polymerase 16